MTRYYKLLERNGTSPFQKTPWLLPKDDEPGGWMPALDEDRLLPCEYGYHACTAAQLVGFWRNHPLEARDTILYEVELAGRMMHVKDSADAKCVASRARLLPRSWKWDQILSAVDPAERAFEKATKRAWEECFKTEDSATMVYSEMPRPGENASLEVITEARNVYLKTLARAAKVRHETLDWLWRQRDETEVKVLAGMGIT